MVPSSPQLCFGKETMSVERQMGTSARMTRSVRLSSMRRKPTGLLGGTARCLRSSKLPHNIVANIIPFKQRVALGECKYYWSKGDALYCVRR